MDSTQFNVPDRSVGTRIRNVVAARCDGTATSSRRQRRRILPVPTADEVTIGPSLSRVDDANWAEALFEIAHAAAEFRRWAGVSTSVSICSRGGSQVRSYLGPWQQMRLTKRSGYWKSSPRDAQPRLPKSPRTCSTSCHRRLIRTD